MKSKSIFNVLVLLLILAPILLCQSDNSQISQSNNLFPSNINYAGVRSSSYGIRPFPQEKIWEKAIKTMSLNYEGAMPAAIWIVGELSNDKGCRLFFPSNQNNYDNIIFNQEDKHEAFLSYFDKAGIKVFLQVEPGKADILTLIELVLARYKHHESVIGFGIDVEWFNESKMPGFGMKVTDADAKCWEERVKSFNPNYKLFLKHWDREWMPANYRGDILFVSDSQEFPDMDTMVNEFSNYWANYFYPNSVAFQIGYNADSKWWELLSTPTKDLGIAISKKVKQNCGIFWVDFTLRKAKLIED